MKLNAINKFNTNFKSSYDVKNKALNVVADKIDPKALSNSLDALAAYNRTAINSHELEEFDLSNLPDVSLAQEFSDDEAMLPEGGFDISSLFNLSSSYIAEQIRHYDKTGELMPYKVAQIIDECKYNGFDDNQTREYLENAKQNFVDEMNLLKQDAKRAIASISPTTSKHDVYRVINKGYMPNSHEYFEKITSLPAGEKVKLDSVPIYVSTSASKVMKNYGGSGAYDAVLFKIKLPIGSKLFTMSRTDGIEQCMLPPDAEFRVIDNKKYKNNFNLVELEYILPEKD